MKIWPTRKLLWSIIVPPRTKKKFALIARLIEVWQLFGLRERFEIRWARYSTPGLCSNAEAGLMCCNMFRMTRSYSQVEHQTKMYFCLSLITLVSVEITFIVGKPRRRIISFDWPITNWRHKTLTDERWKHASQFYKYSALWSHKHVDRMS